ncbi:helix-turn-helix domain-containing protein [Nocardia cyriacigeorgica]|uniref:AraC-like ligand-binding domain-containing protein n=1 Tax=Nocardia cyriacigeorgica TaxID=135487 RepID=UPI001894DB27|nr:helix-turn-helix domain-containing protein [Nocardia cyriacigeorgica]MBF6397460.1 helix-turn-helix domain-containing protein [Nocardia cyriacigeorgica]MBF6402882.1 helix-turn-helix domain-containing protein [Nocardia cyriacigeorgica]
MYENPGLTVGNDVLLPFDDWLERVADAYVPVEAYQADRPLRSAFRGNLCTHQLDGIHFSNVGGGPVAVRRSLRDIRRSDPGYLKIGFQTAGNAVLVQQGKEIAMQPGDFVLYDTSVPYDLLFEGSFGMMVMMVPRNSIDISPRRLDAVLMERCRPAGGPAFALAAEFLRHLDDLLRTDLLPPQPRVAEATLQLICAALDEHFRGISAPGGHAGLYLASRKYINDNLHDVDLSPAMVAAAHHVSLRTLQSVYQAEGETVMNTIRDRRIERCRRDLADPSMDDQSISAICARYGLHNLSHFSHIFKDRYGMAPREFRMNRRATPSA